MKAEIRNLIDQPIHVIADEDHILNPGDSIIVNTAFNIQINHHVEIAEESKEEAETEVSENPENQTPEISESDGE